MLLVRSLTLSLKHSLSQKHQRSKSIQVKVVMLLTKAHFLKLVKSFVQWTRSARTSLLLLSLGEVELLIGDLQFVVVFVQVLGSTNLNGLFLCGCRCSCRWLLLRRQWWLFCVTNVRIVVALASVLALAVLGATSLRFWVIILDYLVEELGRIKEELVDIVARLGRSFDPVLDPVLLLELESLLAGHLTTRLEIELISNHEDDYIGIALVLDLLDPHLQMLKRVPLVNWVTQDDGISGSVENLSNGPEVLLTGRVPNLKLQHTVFHLVEARSEVDPNRDIVVCVELVLGQTIEDAGFSDAYRQKGIRTRENIWSKYAEVKVL